MNKTELWSSTYFFAMLLAALAVGGCSGSAGESPFSPDKGEKPAADQLLPSFPMDLIKTVSLEDADRFCYGADYASELPNQHVAPQGTQLLFSPSWDEGGEPSPDDLAYAMYVFSLDGYDDMPELALHWGAAPADWSCCFVGLGNQLYGRWDWFTDEDISDGLLTLDDLAPYLDGDGGLVMIVLMTGMDSCALGWLRWGGNVAPVAMLEADPLSGSAPLAVSFSATGSYDPDGSLTDFEWDLDGDGEFNETGPEADARSSPTANYTYNDAGTHTPAVQVTDNDDATNTADVEIQVSAENEPPVAELNADPVWGDAPLEVSFSAEGSYDPDGTIENYEWDLDGDGEFGEPGDEANAEGYATAEYTYIEYCTYEPAVRVTDNAGATDSAQVYVSVTSAGPGAWAMYGHDLQNTHRSPHVGAQTNDVKWTFPTGGFVYSCPAIAADGTVYIGSLDNKLYAINPDGSEKWSYTTQYTVSSSPAIGADGVIYVGSNDMRLYAINPDGTLRWYYETEGSVSLSPAIADDGTVYVGSSDDHLYAVSPDGKMKWTYSLSVYRSSPAVGTDGTVYIGGDEAKLHAINPDGSLKWEYATPDHWADSPPAIASDGTIYICSGQGGTGNHHLNAVNPDGSEKWTFTAELAGPAGIGPDGTVYVCSGDFYCLFAINPNGTQKWICYLENKPTGAPPAIGADGTVYIGTEPGNGGIPPSKFYAISSTNSIKWSYSCTGNLTNPPSIGSDGSVYVGGMGFSLLAFGTSD